MIDKNPIGKEDGVEDGDKYFHRVLFLTDMLSGPDDEDSVLNLADAAALRTPNSFLTTIGSEEGTKEGEKGTKKQRRESVEEKEMESKSLPNIFTTVVGIGVDLSVGSVERISSTRGGRYMSVMSGDEFEKTVAKEFPYDMV